MGRHNKKKVVGTHSQKGKICQEEKLEKIKAHIEERCENLQTDIKKMLNSALDRDHNKIVIERVIYNEAGRATCIDEPQEVKEHTRQHFYNWTRKRHTKHDQMSQR